MDTTLGVIGGTGLYELEGLTDIERIEIRTPFGLPSSPIVSGTFEGTRLLFLARHGIGHHILPSEINFRANIYALKSLGAQWVLSVSAVGSLQEDYVPGQLAVPDQLFDRTRGRESTFFGDGIVGHVQFGEPFCAVLREKLISSAKTVLEKTGAAPHESGTYVCMEGPAFSTKAESLWYKSIGASLIGMTALPEAKLAREAELGYAILALVTDYDAWRPHEAAVDVQEVLAVMHKNVHLAKDVIRVLVPMLKNVRPSEAASRALESAIITPKDRWPKETVLKLQALLSRF